MRLEFMINTRQGPAVGELEVPDQDAAATALYAAVRNAFGEDWTETHAEPVKRLCADLRNAQLPATYRVPAVSVTLEA